MGGELTTIQSLKAVDAWIDVINANINGGVRTGFKSSRLKFAGSNVDIVRAGTTTSLPLQIPEAGLTTANTVIDFGQGAITASTENTHLAIQGEGFFVLVSPGMINLNRNAGNSWGAPVSNAPGARMMLTRDGEFRTDQDGFLRATNGYYLVTCRLTALAGRLQPDYEAAVSGFNSGFRAVYNDLDNPTMPTMAGAQNRSVLLSNFLTGAPTTDVTGALPANTASIMTVPMGKQSLLYSQFGSTVFDFGWTYQTARTASQVASSIGLGAATTSDATILSKSLEASNASMTQSVPELSLAQKLFSALTKVLQTKQTNVDGVLNLVR